MRLRLPPRLKRFIRELIAEEESKRGRGTITKREGHTTYVTDTDVDTPSLKIGGTEVIDSSRNIKNIADANIEGKLIAYQIRVPGLYARPRLEILSTGNFGPVAERATETETTKNSPSLYFIATYWDGSASVDRYAKILHRMLSTTPTSELLFQVPSGTNVMAIGDGGLKLWKDRLRLLSDGAKITFGSAEDVILYRAGADLLKTDDDLEVRSLKIGNDLEVGGVANVCQATVVVGVYSTTDTAWRTDPYGWSYMPIDLGKFGSSYFRFNEVVTADGQSHGTRLYNETDATALAVHETTGESAGVYTHSLSCTPPSGVKLYHVQLHSDGTHTYRLRSACLQSGSSLRNLFLVELEEVEEEFVDIDGEVKRRMVRVPMGWSRIRFSYGIHAYSLETLEAVIAIPDEDVKRVIPEVEKLRVRFEEVTEAELRKLQERWRYIRVP